MTNKKLGRPPSGNRKKTMMGMRIYDDDLDLIKKLFGSNQKFLDAMIKKLREEA